MQQIFPTVEVFVPGRLCILGEHTDWAGQYRSTNQDVSKGVCIVCATNEGLHAKVSAYAPGHLCYDHYDDKGELQTLTIPFDSENMRLKASTGYFYGYIVGTAAVVLDSMKFRTKVSEYSHRHITASQQPQHHHHQQQQQSLSPSAPSSSATATEVVTTIPGITSTVENASLNTVPGIHIENFCTTLPMKKGLSSSAAICVLVAKAFNEMYSIGYSLEELMDIAFRGEMLTPSRCGRMDQCVVLGKNAIGAMEFDGSSQSLYPCTLRRIHTAAPLYFVVVDLNAVKDTVKILADLHACFPIAANETQLLLHEYVADNIDISSRAIHAIERGDVLRLAECMNRAQQSFDRGAAPNCIDQLKSPILHSLIDDAHMRSDSDFGVLAVKGIGSQGDGSCQILCRTQEGQQKVVAYLQTRYKMSAFPLTLTPE